jgi:hypothetical protein
MKITQDVREYAAALNDKEQGMAALGRGSAACATGTKEEIEAGMASMSEKFRQMSSESTLRRISFKPVNTLNLNRSLIVLCRLLHPLIGVHTSPSPCRVLGDGRAFEQWNIRGRTMVQKTKMVIIAAIAASSFAAPAFAQSFSRGDGTGNELPSYFNGDGSLHFGYPPSHEQTTIATKGLYAYAKTTRPRSH